MTLHAHFILVKTHLSTALQALCSLCRYQVVFTSRTCRRIPSVTYVFISYIGILKLTRFAALPRFAVHRFKYKVKILDHKKNYNHIYLRTNVFPAIVFFSVSTSGLARLRTCSQVATFFLILICK